MKLVDQRPGQLVPGRQAFRSRQAMVAALDIEDRVDPGDFLQRDRGDLLGGLGLPGVPLDVSEIEELAPGMVPARRRLDRLGMAVGPVEVVVAAIGIGLQDALPSGETLVRISHPTVAGKLEPCRRMSAVGKRTIEPNIGPEPSSLRASLRKQRHYRVVAVQSLGRETTHDSTTAPAVRLYKESPGTGAMRCFLRHTLMEICNGLVVQGDLTLAGGHAEREAALDMVYRHSPGSTRRVRLGADKWYELAVLCPT